MYVQSFSYTYIICAPEKNGEQFNDWYLDGQILIRIIFKPTTVTCKHRGSFDSKDTAEW